MEKTSKKNVDEVTAKLVQGEGLIGENDNDKIADLAFQLLINSQIFKQPRMNQMIKYERLYNNDVAPKLRQLFNVPIPVFPGMVDSLLADFNDQIQIKFKALNPAQYLVTPKVQAQWEAERDSLAPNAMWNKKAREDRFNAVLFGRGILEIFAENDPTYRSVLNVINYSDFHWQPLGGSNLEEHLFCGKEGMYKTVSDLEQDDRYDQTQVAKLKAMQFNDAFWQNVQDQYGTKLARFRSLGLDVESNSFAGEATFNFCQFIVPWKGQRMLVVFEPNSKVWVRIKPWKEIRPSGLYPWISWATHEDHKNFASKSYADDFYYSADSIITMFNQELTNREKKNYNARAFDKDMFTDVAKLDAAQYRPDALVPADTKGGTRQISTGIYAFETPELQGTVNLIQFVNAFTNQQTGVGEPSPTPPKKASVQIMQNQQKSKRVGLRSDSFKEGYAQLGLRYLEDLREYMPPSISVQVVGENGFIEEQELKRIDVKRSGNMGVSVTSTSEQEGSDNMKRDGRIKAIEMVAQNQSLNKYEKETIYRDIGQFDESEINFLMDDIPYTARKQIAHASQSIQDLLLNREPDIYYGADVSYLEYFDHYMTEHKNQIEKKKEAAFMAHLNIMGPIVKNNSDRKAKNAPPQPQVGPDGKPIAPPAGAPPAPAGGAPASKPAPAPVPSPIGAAQKMGAMAS